ncbi:hypothetical protein ACFQY7_03735 [Actinomadura luteofluorescens]|uniref:hypothetical protein n=1 Tax=Actinomadura luteofluorescens TaxID=46163 RepID=UPI003639A979
MLVQESFTRATADARFIGYGAACLTGAARASAAAEATNHPLGGCRRDPVGPVPPGNAASRGYLQLTDAHFEETGAALFDSPIPTRGGLEVTFEQWQYGNTTRAPADGISFFLTDGARSLNTPGAFGGSLGYAQKLPGGRAAGNSFPESTAGTSASGSMCSATTSATGKGAGTAASGVPRPGRRSARPPPAPTS